MANDFRDYLREDNGQSSRVAKGAFVALDGADESEAEEQEKDGQKGKRLRRDHQGGGRHKKQKTEESSGRTTCYGCGGFHRLTKCFYAFPQQAHQDWRPRKEIMDRYKEELRTNTKLQEQVKKLEIKKKQSEDKGTKEESH